METTTILIIDDEKAVRESLAAYLDDCGYTTLTAGNGREGLELFEREHADLVLVDLRMPGWDGLEVLARIKAISTETPLIVVSGTGVIRDAVEALRQGAWEYVLKPIEDFSVLNHAVDNCLEKARLQRENREYQQRLERMVAERTAELEQANAHLWQINERLRRIVETTRSLAFCGEMKQFGSLLLEEFGDHMLATGGSLYLAEKHGLRLMHCLDPGHATEFIPFPLGEGSVFHQAISLKKPVLIRDISQHKDLKRSGWDGYHGGSALVFPLPDESGSIAGILSLHSKVPPPFVEQDREIGMILASYSCEALRAVRATENLRNNERQFRNILDAIQTSIIVVDAASFEILYANPTASRMVGAPVDSLVGRLCHETYCTDRTPHCPIGCSDPEVVLAERYVQTTDRGNVPVLKSVTRTQFQGKECLLQSFTDLSGQKRAEAEKAQLERQLRQAQKMEALGTLAGGIAHDFNNILAAVMGYAELGLMQLADPTHPLHTKLKAICQAGQRAKDLVGQILAFSRMREKVRAPLSVAPIIDESINLLRSSLPANITIHSDIRTHRQVMADPTQIHQVLMNLCTNAYHALERSGGSLHIELEEVNLDKAGMALGVELPPGEYVRIAVSDTGCGISPAVIDRIFEPYFTTKSKSQGTGLGLAVVHGIVRSHLGAISVESRIGEGTRFSIYLPVAVETGSHDVDELKPLPRGLERVLLVDDENALIDIGQQMLEALGYRVTAVKGGDEALETLRRSPDGFDLMITDLNMPGISGVHLAQEAIQIRPDIPIVLCTGFSEWFGTGGRRTPPGIRRVLMKPVTMESLARAVREVLEEPRSDHSLPLDFTASEEA